MHKILISACLLGNNCRYDGGNCFLDEINSLKDKVQFVPVCPEVLGGLTIPRHPSEIVKDKVINIIGEDVSNNYILGSQKALEIYEKEKCLCAIFKQRSPSCGFGQIYDGSFKGKIIEGKGITAKLFLEKGIKIYSENDLDKLIAELKTLS